MILRSHTRRASFSQPESLPPSALSLDYATSNLLDQVDSQISGLCRAKQDGFMSDDQRSLLRKRHWLKTNTLVLPNNYFNNNANFFINSSDTTSIYLKNNDNPIDAIYIFALNPNNRNSTAFCISPSGVLLTCARCIASTPRDLDVSKVHCLLSSSGDVVLARTVAWDLERDLALLVICESSSSSASSTSGLPYPYIKLSNIRPDIHETYRIFPIIFIGGASTANDETPLVLGEAFFAKQDPLCNDIFVYSKTSTAHAANLELAMGTPLVDKKTGTLVGLHSGWDCREKVKMKESYERRAVSWDSVVEFLTAFEKEKKKEKGASGLAMGQDWKWFVR